MNRNIFEADSVVASGDVLLEGGGGGEVGIRGMGCGGEEGGLGVCEGEVIFLFTDRAFLSFPLVPFAVFWPCVL